MIAGVLGAACTPGAPTINVIASEFKFEPATITVKAGQPVQLSLRNGGSVAHDLTFEGEGQYVHVHSMVGMPSAKTFTLQTAGTYRFVCSEPGHEAAGMVGQLIVE
jgi:nitrite reductase (NO-forming)